MGLANIFYCLRFETSFFTVSYDSQGYGGGIRPRLHTGDSLLSAVGPGADCTENIASNASSLVDFESVANIT
jgi:hypothetical protein